MKIINLLAYSSDWLTNIEVKSTARNWYAKAYISADELKNIASKYQTGFYSPPFSIRTGLFLFTCIVASAVAGLSGLWLSDFINYKAITCLYGLCAYVALEYFVVTKKHYKSGIDDALLYLAVAFLVSAVYLYIFDFIDNNLTSTGMVALFTAGILLWSTVRFTDTVCSAGFVMSVLLLVSVLVLKIGSMVLLPFTGCLASYGVYIGCQFLLKAKKYSYWQTALHTMETTALLTGYLFVNYFVVKEAGAEFFGKTLSATERFLFYSFTVAIPVVYIYRGFYLKNRILLRCGAVLSGVAVCTLQHYNPMVPTETALCIAGAVLIGISYYFMRYLKSPQQGYSCVEEQDTALNEAEGWLLAHAFSKTLPDHQIKSGGGSFGGAGANADF